MKKSVDKKALILGEKKLRGSGLTLEDANKLKITILSPQDTTRLHPSFKPLRSLRIGYHGPDGAPLQDWPRSSPFYRVRYLEEPGGFNTLTEKKPQRYAQEPGTAPVAYYPQNQPGWEEIVSDPDQPLVITEGEFKAAAACKAGFPTIGLGGVYNWRSIKLGLDWLPSLDLVRWIKRNVYICYDSDYHENPMVCSALKDLAHQLHRRGAFTYLVSLPQLAGLDKVGLDDFLVHSGPSAPEMLGQLLHQAEPLGLTAPLWQLNERYAYVRNPGLVIDQQAGFKVTPSALTQHLEATQQYQERQLKHDGSISYKAVSAAAAWLRWPLRTEVQRLTYSPGQPRLMPTEGGVVFNTWPGWGVKRKKGDVKPFLQLIDHLFTGAEPKAKEWFLNWAAYPLQHPGVKMFTSSVMHGIRHGTGKSIIGYTLGRIYGSNFTEISQMDLHSQFNEWAESKQFVMGDDVTGSNKRQDADFLKKLITQKEMRVNIKHVPTYTVPDCINYYFTANHPDSFFLEDDDRRHFIHEVTVDPLSEEFYVEYDLWLSTTGPSALFDWLLRRDTGDFNPSAPAFRTSARDRMITNVQSDLAGWVRQLMLMPDHILKLGEVVVKKDLFTNKELLQFYDPTGRTGVTGNGLGRELSRAGFRQVCDGRPVRLKDGTQHRYYAIRNQDKWLKAAPRKITKYLNDHDLGDKNSPKKY